MGCLLRELRKEKGMTQEQMAEIFGVTNRTVSRWENGINMPDISILVEISNYFEVGILELIEGERKRETMIMENNEKFKKIANYADEQNGIVLKKVHRTDVVGLVSCILSGVVLETYVMFGNNILLFLHIVCVGIVGGMLSWNIFYLSGLFDKFNQYEKKYRIIKWLEILVLIIVLILICKDAYLILQ